MWESGPLGPAPTIAFLHGGGIGGWMWTPQVERLRREHRRCLLVPDSPEHGSRRSEKPFTIRSTAEGIAELILSRAGTDAPTWWDSRSEPK